MGARQCGQKVGPGREGGGRLAGPALEVQGAGRLLSGRGAEAPEHGWPKSGRWTVGGREEEEGLPWPGIEPGPRR